MKFNKLLTFIIYSFHLTIIFGNWESQLNDYDIIPRFKLRTSRSYDTNRKIYFKSKYRDFKLILKPAEGLFTNDFQASNVDRYGQKTPIFIDRSQFYEGFVSGSHKSSVRAFLGSDDTVNINIAMNNDIYQLESMSRYESSNSSMIIYRLSDLKSNSSKGPLCPSSTLSLNSSNYSDIRKKRSADDVPILNTKTGAGEQMKKYCTIRLVADFRFYREHSRGEDARTQNYLIELMDNINQLFKITEFTDSNNNKYVGYGFLIKDIEVHSDWTVGIPGHYNERRSENPDAWTCEKLLNSFGAHDFSDVCLSHLFTYQSFTEGTLGLAWIATWKSMEHGGICSARTMSMKSVNAAWSTYKDAASNHLISLSAYLVTAHELGHNWGADHDPDTKECSPNANGGGKYVMYTYSVVGYEMNNRIFSPCSKRSIGETIKKRGNLCFETVESGAIAFCGNRRVENSEQCDVGSNNKYDKCCTPDCKFRPGMVCSQHNHECCTPECQIKSHGSICAIADVLNPCLGDAVCDGFNKTCLPPTALSGLDCTEHGKCLNGRCIPLCETINLEACICDKIEETCSICCRNKTISPGSVKECQPASRFRSSKIELKLNDGRPCSRGFCNNGLCKRTVSKLIERIWKIIDTFDTNLFAAFLLDNLVGTVVFCSLLLWIPASIVVSCQDAKHRKLILNERSSRRPQVTPLANF